MTVWLRELRKDFVVDVWGRPTKVEVSYEDDSEPPGQFHSITVRWEYEQVCISLYDGSWEVNDDGRSFSVLSRDAHIRTSVGPIAVVADVRSDDGWSAAIDLYAPNWQRTLSFRLSNDGGKTFEGWD